jgi:hypothetical protein
MFLRWVVTKFWCWGILAHFCWMVCYKKLNITYSSFSYHKQNAKGLSKDDGYIYCNFKVNKEHLVALVFTSVHELCEGGCLKGDDTNMKKSNKIMQR